MDDSKLGEVSKSCLSAVEYLRKMALDIGVTNASRDTLLSVGLEVCSEIWRWERWSNRRWRAGVWLS